MPSALILGASSDMALAIARTFGAGGYDLILCGRKVSRLAPMQSDLEIRFGVRAFLAEFDAEDPGSHQAFYDSLGQRPDVAICVMGFMPGEKPAEQDWKTVERTILVNYTGAVSILNLIAADFASIGKGTIVGISSVAGLRGRQSNYIYGSAKAGFLTYLSGLRNRLYPMGIHVVTVLPGFVRTRMTENLPLPPLLTAEPAEVGKAVFQAVKQKKNLIYVRWFWRWIMLLIRLIPESRFKKMKL
ncbi:MAG TPA: SDR family oxidoreductase [Chitinophagaceae bacterium]|nr:SDR family oxidoreductase [Chitinophagaceae bacterium]